MDVRGGCWQGVLLEGWSGVVQGGARVSSPAVQPEQQRRPPAGGSQQRWAGSGRGWHPSQLCGRGVPAVRAGWCSVDCSTGKGGHQSVATWGGTDAHGHLGAHEALAMRHGAM